MSVSSAGPPTPWERQPGEGARAYAAFCAYRDLGPVARSIRKVAQECHKNYSLIGRWSREWRWVGRCGAWDAENEQVRRRALSKSLADMARRQALEGQLMQARAAARFAAMSADDARRLSVLMAVRMVEVGARLERSARAIPDSGLQVDESVGPDPSTYAPTNLLGLLRAHPERVGPAVEALRALHDALSGLEAGDGEAPA